MRLGLGKDDKRRLNVEKFEHILEADTPVETGPTESVRIYFISTLSRSRFEVDLIEPGIFTLVVLGMDIFEWVLSSLAFSSMKQFPKPIVAVESESKESNIRIEGGRRPMENTASPLQTSLDLVRTTSNNALSFLLGRGESRETQTEKKDKSKTIDEELNMNLRAKTESGRVALPENSPFVFAIYASQGNFFLPSDMQSEL